MKKRIEDNLNRLKALIDLIDVTDMEGCSLSLPEGIELAVKRVSQLTKGKLIFIGNGASASIASHMACDFWKNTGVRAIAFNDGALLTCISNDYGYKHVFEKPIEMFAEPEDILFAISSSGKSENILRGIGAARQIGCAVLTLSGFETDNPLRRLGNLNFYVPSSRYGPVEVLHHALCHCLVDLVSHLRSIPKIKEGFQVAPTSKEGRQAIKSVAGKSAKSQSYERIKL